MIIQDNNKILLGLLGHHKPKPTRRKTIHFDWSARIRKPVAPQLEIKSQTLTEVVIPPQMLAADVRGLPLCKHCGKPILWGQVTEEYGEKSKRGLNSWIPFDPDYSFHGCRS